MNPYTTPGYPGILSAAPEAERASFIRKTYGHLAAAIALFVLLEAGLILSGAASFALQFLAVGKFAWLAVMIAFVVVSSIANKWATNGSSVGMQYAGLILYTVAEAIIFLPMIVMALAITEDASLLLQAAFITSAMLLGLTTIAFTTRKDFSFLGGILKMAGFVAIGLILASFFLPITLGLWFSAAMCLFASGSILYSTSNLFHRYEPGQHVAAALSLFAGVALLFWYVLRLLMSLSRR